MNIAMQLGPTVIAVFAITCAAVVYLAHKSGIFDLFVIEELSIGPCVLIYFNVQEPHDQYLQHIQELEHKMVEDARLVHVADKELISTLCIRYDSVSSGALSKKPRSSYCCLIQNSKLQGVDATVGLLKELSVVKSGEMKVGVFPESRCLAVRCPVRPKDSLNLRVSLWRARRKLVQEAMKKLGKHLASEGLASGVLDLHQPKLETITVALPLTPRNTFLPFNSD
ncbi:hypothetical protein CEUSTIGMA_g9511.t1 [Chlamydomonas eustigma]|uniref:Uncharacterized protein n=1 Tax=Chlamydomonas eustigma TaxID=1157962 RepID=A0A250XGA8_9CHLO|nr:hypothetical protein CEUSTIGMA_g9511.t1 [Chlamydomonas eustigma]|eukprot:GAX82083.1 hypothetical protein CEUSTIGMA_g9511.t1 [Chlamydomonas eustigma]